MFGPGIPHPPRPLSYSVKTDCDFSLFSSLMAFSTISDRHQALESIAPPEIGLSEAVRTCVNEITSACIRDCKASPRGETDGCALIDLIKDYHDFEYFTAQ